MITVFNFENRKQATSVGFALSFIHLNRVLHHADEDHRTMPPCLSVKVRLFLVGHTLPYLLFYRFNQGTESQSSPEGGSKA